MKIRTVTFHHAHNYGSVLQAYALQTFIEKLMEEEKNECDYKIINYYTEFQEEFYSILKKDRTMKNALKNLIALFHYKKLKIKYDKFEFFLEDRCHLTKRYKTYEELKNEKIEADYFISGSDQLWNVRALDFSDIYYLNFVNSGRKISYSASFGPLNIDWNLYDKNKYAEYLKDFSAISVREKQSFENVKYLTGCDCSINVDPTLLLEVDEWRKIQSDANYDNGNYILLYCLEPTKQQLKMANIISKKLKLPILVLKYNNKNDMFNNFIKKYDAGPQDFLSYIDHAALVLSSSFYGTVFSLIYNKPFYVFDGMTDNRISTLLEKSKMSDRSISNENDIFNISLTTPSFKDINVLLNDEISKSRNYLRKVLNLEK